jgi:EAL domain-containing protein (putative c-di-GMP-specific phosphodiesterase class I)
MTASPALDAAIDRAVDPTGIMQRVADETLALVPAADGVSIGLTEGDTVTCVCGAGRLSGAVGLPVRITGGLSELASRQGRIVRTDDAAEDPLAKSDTARDLGIGSVVCVPLQHGALPIGMLYVAASRTHAFVDADVVTLTKVAAFLAIVIGNALDCARVTRELLGSRDPDHAPGTGLDVEGRFVANIIDPGRTERLEAQQRIEAVLERGLLSMVFQPIVELGSGAVVGVEALARFASDPVRSPDIWFAEAHRVGLGSGLELAAIRAALTELSELPGWVFLAINVGPDVLVSRSFTRLLHAVDASRVVIELTEHSRIEDYRPIQQAVASLRAAGARLALDDTGAGYAGLNHILKLTPDFIKLDRVVTSSIDQDPVRRALATALVSFASSTGATIIAEGIETDGELAVLRGLGIAVGQGFRLGRPTPLRVITDGLVASVGQP